MAKAELASNDPPASSARPSTSEATCPTCGKSVDPLRAGHVALLGERFHYFCSQTCSAQFLEPHHSRLTEETREPPAVAERPTPTPSPSVRSLVLPARPARQLVTREVHVVTDERRDHEERNQSLLVRPVHRAPIAAPSAPAPWLGFLLTLCALSASLIGASSARIGDHGSDVALGAILCALALEIVQRARTRTRPTLQSVIAFAPLLAAVGIAVYAAHEEPAPAALSTVGLLLFGYVALRALSARLARETSHEVQTLLRAIAGKTHEVGEVIELHAPTFVPVDGVIVSGHGELRPNGVRGAAQPVSAGELVFAGNKLVVGTLEVRAQQVGDERALVRLFGEGTLHRMWPQRYTVIERVVAVGTLLAAITVGLFAWVSREEPWHPFLLATTVAGVVGMLYGLHLPRLLWARGVLAAIEHGVMFPSFATCDRTSFVEQLVLAGRGVVFSGAPQFVDLVWFGADHDRELILAEIAGAEARATHPLGICLHTALVSRGVEPGAMRGIEEKPGLGVVARTRANAQLIVGNRELLLRNAISMAGVEARALELESERREVLYVARGGRLCAFAVFEDSLCEGSFAAV